MKPITFFDTEVSQKEGKILDIGAVKSDGNIFNSGSVKEFAVFLSDKGFVCGHNILQHDLAYLKKALPDFDFSGLSIIDTLYLSPLLFPKNPYHSLLKDDKLLTEELNNPVNDSQKARDLFFDELTAFENLDVHLKQIYYSLLHNQLAFKAFFNYVSYISPPVTELATTVLNRFALKICSNAPLHTFISDHPVELAYCLSLLTIIDRNSITPPWVIKNYPEVEGIMSLLTNKPCEAGCNYCSKALNVNDGLKRYFGYDSYRKYDGEALQEKAVEAAILSKSLLAVFPTGGGKSLTFQVPALMAGENAKGLTVVISPLQSLMKDQVDNLENKGITEAVTINGMLDPIERAKSFERVESGSASLLYISPESLRSKSIERLLLGRKVVRFVIDEAHCFSSWGHDFRVDYLYIGDFIRSLQQKKNLSYQIPVSCFTATARQRVIEDIKGYFKEKLSLNLEIFVSKSSRTNLHYKVFSGEDEEQKYNKVRELIESRKCPTIIYISRTKKAYALAEKLDMDGYSARAYHGKMDIKEKSENQNAFISGDIDIMVATSAFGMGVDKSDVGMVIHYDISSSLENYVQESGRAGRDEAISADCFVLFNEEDLNKHFLLHNQTKLSVKEIQQVWKAIKEITKFRSSVSNSVLEIARKAGWDDNVSEIETRVTTAIAALEESGYLQRGQNSPRIYANSILTKNAQEAIGKIRASSLFNEAQRVKAIRIIKKLFSTKSKKHANDEEGESRIDHISDHLGMVKEEVIKIISLLREENILADTKDLTAFIKHSDQMNRSMSILESFAQIENYLFSHLEEKEKVFNLKELNEGANEEGIKNVSPHRIKATLNFWAIKNLVKRVQHSYSKNHISVICTGTKDSFKEQLRKRHELSKFILNQLFEKSRQALKTNEIAQKEILVEFSVHDLKQNYEKENRLFGLEISVDEVEDALFFLSKIEAIKIEGGFLVVYNKLTINRLELNNKVQYKIDDYNQLDQHYQNKVKQIHIVGEYAKKMLDDYNKALRFVDDYFQMDYQSFERKHFPGSRRDELRRNITEGKFEQLFGTLSPRQLAIIKDNQTTKTVVAAGPGSGKTRVLVHKLASLLLLEDVKHEQLLMLTFSRAATTEFKKRLLDLVGNVAHRIEIKTFHSYCFDLLGRVGSIEKSDDILQMTTDKIINNEVELSRITKSVLVIDEAQDMNKQEFALVTSIMDRNEEMRVIAVGDDDQNIYTFRGADSKYFRQFAMGEDSVRHELIENYRSKKNLVDFTNQFVESIRDRFKSIPIVSKQPDNGEIRIVSYRSKNLIVPLVEDLLATRPSGTTGILTKTNEEALQIAGMLKKNNISVKIIQSTEEVKIFDLHEVRSFMNDLEDAENSPVITEDVWNNAKRKFAQIFRESSNYEICKQLLVNFQETNTRTKYRSDFEVFIRESRIEDFTFGAEGHIFLSTVHKAKGKEFDNVFIMLKDFDIVPDDHKRQLYVAMTRAKRNLYIHYNGTYLNNYIVGDLKISNDTSEYQPQRSLNIQLGYSDVNLSYFKFVQHRITSLQSGQKLTINENDLQDDNEDVVVKYSAAFNLKKESLQQKGYRLMEATVKFIIYWKGKEDDEEFKIVFPELVFSKG